MRNIGRKHLTCVLLGGTWLLLAGEHAVAQFVPLCSPKDGQAVVARLAGEREKMTVALHRFNTDCARVARGSPKAADCEARFDTMTLMQRAHNARVRAYCDPARVTKRVTARIDYEELERRTTVAMVDFWGRLGWPPEEQALLLGSLGKLRMTDDDFAKVGEPWEIAATWGSILDRDDVARKLAEKAARGDGPGLPGAGTQATFADCAVFALATATGRPYGEIARLANDLIRRGDWRPKEERDNPQKAIEDNGLMGGEVMMVARTLGHAEVIDQRQFARALKEGHRVMVNVVPRSGNFNLGHQVVLSKAFQHGGEAWYELIDSRQGPMRRLYLTAAELQMIARENGIVYRPDKDRVMMLPR